MSALGRSIVQSDQELIEIPIYYKTTQNKYGTEKIVIIPQEEAKEILDGIDDEAKKAISVVNTKWLYATWEMQNSIIQASMKPQGHGEEEMDWNRYRDLRVKRLLHSWDLMYENQAIPVTSDVLNRVPPQFFIGLFESYENYVGFSEEEKGKS